MSPEAQRGSVQMAAGYEGVGCRGSRIEIAPVVFGDVKELGEAVRNAEAMGVAGIKVELKRFINGVEV